MNASAARILVIDDDTVFADVLARSLQRRGQIARPHDSIAGALAIGGEFAPTHIVLDLKLGADDGLLALPELLARWPAARVLLLTGYASIATAVAAIKRGAHDYLAKPADAARCYARSGSAPTPTPRPSWKPKPTGRCLEPRRLGTHPARAAGTGRQCRRHRARARHASAHAAAHPAQARSGRVNAT